MQDHLGILGVILVPGDVHRLPRPRIHGSTDFAIVGNTCGAALMARDSCSIAVRPNKFHQDMQDGRLVVRDNAINSPQTVFLEGNRDDD